MGESSKQRANRIADERAKKAPANDSEPMRCMARLNGTCDYVPPFVKDLLVIDSVIVVQSLTSTVSANNYECRLGIQRSLGKEALHWYPTFNQPLLI